MLSPTPANVNTTPTRLDSLLCFVYSESTPNINTPSPTPFHAFFTSVGNVANVNTLHHSLTHSLALFAAKALQIVTLPHPLPFLVVSKSLRRQYEHSLSTPLLPFHASFVPPLQALHSSTTTARKTPLDSFVYLLRKTLP